MTYFEIFISTMFTVSVTAIGGLLWRLLAKQQSSIDSLKVSHYQTRDEHEERLNGHATELQKHTLEITHSREMANRAEREMRMLMQEHNQKFDQVIDIFKQTMKRK